MPGHPTLAGRLQELRRAAGLTQLALSRALGVSVPSISAWEKGAVPPAHRLEAYARLFAPTGDGDLRTELLALRAPAEPDPATVAHPLTFRPGEAITVVSTRLPDDRRAVFGNADPDDADHIEAYRYADLDALIALLPAVSALNPASPVAVGTPEDVPFDKLTAHLLVLGGVDWNPVTAALARHLDKVPVQQLERDTDDDVGGFVVGSGDDRAEHKPRVRTRGGKATLIEDVAHILRAPNPYNRQRTLTVFNGSYSRGTYGAVRALTDPEIGVRNAAYLAERFAGVDTYSVVCRVRMVARRVVVPDWTLADDRLHEWP